MGVILPKSVCQIALVVSDIEKVAKNYADLFGVPVPDFFLVPPPEDAHTIYNGKPTSTRAKLCVFDLGQVVLELTQADGEPSSWKQYQEEHGEGVHHIGFKVSDREAVMDYFHSLGVTERHYGEYTGGNYTFMNTERDFGVIFNIKYEEEKK